MHALEEIGFVILTNHGISRKLLDSTWNITRDLFDTSYENKMKAPMTETYMYGYSAEEILSRSETKDGYGHEHDQKETFQAWIGAPNSNRNENVLWPPNPHNLELIWTQYYR